MIWASVNMGKCKQCFEMDGKDDPFSFSKKLGQSYMNKRVDVPGRMEQDRARFLHDPQNTA